MAGKGLGVAPWQNSLTGGEWPGIRAGI